MAELQHAAINSAEGTILSLEGEIDVSNSHLMRTLLLQTLEQANRLNLNLRAVTSMDSSGIAVLLEIHDKARNSSKFFRVLEVSDRVHEALKLLCLDTMLLGDTSAGLRHAITHAEEGTILSFEGEIDFFNVHVMSAILLQTLSQTNRLALDLRAVTSMDSSGVNALLETYHQARDSGKSFCVLEVSDRVRTALKLLCLDTLLIGSG